MKRALVVFASAVGWIFAVLVLIWAFMELVIYVATGT